MVVSLDLNTIPILDYQGKDAITRYMHLAGFYDPSFNEKMYYIRMEGYRRELPKDELFYREFSFLSEFTKCHFPG